MKKQASRKKNPTSSKTKPAKHTRNPGHRRRKKNGAGLGAFIGSLGGVAANGLIMAMGAPVGLSLPLGIALSATGGALGGQYAAPSDRKRRGAEGGGIGGVFGPIGAAIGGYIGGTKADKHKNPASAVVVGTVLAIAGIGTVVGVRHVMKKRAAMKALPSNQPGATPENQGASAAIPPEQIPQGVLDAELAKGGVPLEPWWKTRVAHAYRDHFIRIDEDMRMEMPYMNSDNEVCLKATVRWVVVAGQATWLATGTLSGASACSSAPQAIALDQAREKIFNQATLAAMDWIDIAFPKNKVA